MSMNHDAIVQLSFEVQGLLGELAAEHDLSLTQFRLLAILRDREPAMLDLARHLKLEKSSATGGAGSWSAPPVPATAARSTCGSRPRAAGWWLRSSRSRKSACRRCWM